MARLMTSLNARISIMSTRATSQMWPAASVTKKPVIITTVQMVLTMKFCFFVPESVGTGPFFSGAATAAGSLELEEAAASADALPLGFDIRVTVMGLAGLWEGRCAIRWKGVLEGV